MALLHQFLAGLSDRDNLMAEHAEGLLKIVPHFRFIVGDGDLQSFGHDCSLGKMITISAP